jgi:hypothetical protein
MKVEIRYPNAYPQLLDVPSDGPNHNKLILAVLELAFAWEKVKSHAGLSQASLNVHDNHAST